MESFNFTNLYFESAFVNETHLAASQVSKIELFLEIVNSLEPSSIPIKDST